MARRRRRRASSIDALVATIIVVTIITAIAPTVMHAIDTVVNWPHLLVYRHTGNQQWASTAEWVYAIVVVAALAGGPFALRAYKRRRVMRAQQRLARRSGLADIDAMTGVEFEQFVAARMASAGWRVSTTPVTGDFGVDLIARANGGAIAVQCKRYARPVGVKAVQEVVSGAVRHGCSQTMVVSNQEFTRQARELAAAHNCTLIGRTALPHWHRPSTPPHR